ncbi:MULTISPECIES: phage major capsid protein [Streptomyces]|uniref:Phage major capsid protein n=1 Tax=Streptomyces dengpaensis TaxID=2049881 RepID=A0ABM6SV98_9ACTN|nr:MULTISPECIES: phage major capsid protein [Streptomyces]AVH58666.1 phage major capsid protein [Streptomyces dengpaensis]PIB11274.1 hypothetical protein B1C81_05520 [Streptomyces sp. HG99]
MSELAKRLNERRLSAYNEAKAIVDRAGDENRAFTGEEEQTWTRLNDEIDTIDERVKNVLAMEKRAKDADTAMFGGAPRKGDGSPAGNPDQDLADQFRKLAAGEIRNIDVAMPSAFERRQLSGGVENRSLIKSGAPVPTTFIGQLYNYLVDTSTMRATNPTVYTTSSGENLTVPISTAEGTATWTAENVALTPSDPTLSSVTLGSFKVGKSIFISYELLQDTGFDLLGFISQHAGRNIGIAVDQAYVAGAGGTRPEGFLVNAGLQTTSMGTGTVNGFVAGVTQADTLYDAFHGVLPQYRPRGSWLMHDTTIKAARKLKDTTGQYLWQPALTAGVPDTLLGRPVYADPNMEQFGATGRKVIAFGDFGGYFIRDVTPLRFERSDDFKFDTDMVSFRVLYRTDGKLGDTQAIRVLTTLT